MEITLEQIDLIRKRANVSYKEAKEALEKFNGNIVETLSFLEEQNKIKSEGGIKDSSFMKNIQDSASRLNKINFIIYKNEKTVLNISSLIALTIGVFTLPFSIAVILLLVLTHHKIRLEKDNGEECSINDKIDKISSDLTSATDKIVNEFK
ncbi:DUF4342 domain-containing protein [Tissierella carlieri]|uniref:DUF4342 domain-containing protein n=1 Tax=Tissierella carlieri TaxID=689904 RepID=A0ABT1SGP3_9FIRM|nr:DUF4342 domain-containing protein [Tissierella carlieri]MBU5310685.1 DUF4342 domain-containing protein [Tissierella carlieri]MCQ4925670.1 DUF4342 domain-containing protein [Tissierella carlieri]